MLSTQEIPSIFFETLEPGSGAGDQQNALKLAAEMSLVLSTNGRVSKMVLYRVQCEPRTFDFFVSY